MSAETKHETMPEGEAEPGFFVALERFERELSPPADTGLKRDAGLVIATALGMLLTFAPFSKLVGSNAQLWLSAAGLLLQLVGLSVIAYRQVRDIIPDFIDAKRKFAVEMDEHFSAREKVLVWLREQPETVRHTRLRYVEARLETLRSRYALVFGAVEKLGILPVLVGVFVQLQAWKSMSFLTMMMGIFIISLYLMGLWLMGYRLQMESYARLIRAAEGERR